MLKKVSVHYFIILTKVSGISGFPGGSVVKNPPTNAGGERGYRFNPCSGRSPGVDNGNPLQHSCLGNPMDREAWWATSTEWQRAGHDLTHSTRTRYLVPILACLLLINYQKKKSVIYFLSSSAVVVKSVKASEKICTSLGSGF